MATRKRKSGARRHTSARARKAPTTAAHKPRRHNPRRPRRHTALARTHHRRTARRRHNPTSGKLVPLILGAGVSQIIASMLPFNFGGVIGDAAKVAGVGWLLEKFGGRAVPMVFGEAKEGGFVAAGVLLFNAYAAAPLRGALSNVLPGGGGASKGVNGIAVTPYPIAPGVPLLTPPTAVPAGMHGMAAVPRMR